VLRVRRAVKIIKKNQTIEIPKNGNVQNLEAIKEFEM